MAKDAKLYRFINSDLLSLKLLLLSSLSRVKNVIKKISFSNYNTQEGGYTITRTEKNTSLTPLAIQRMGE